MVGELIRTRRVAKGWSQTTLGRQMGWPQNYVSRVEGGKVELPQRDTLERLGKLLGVSLQEFYRAAGVLDALPAEVVPPRHVEEPTGDKDWDPRELITWMFRHPDKRYVARLERLAERLPPEAFERIALKLARAQLMNGELAIGVAEELIDLEK